MKPYVVHYLFPLNGNTVTRRVSVPATSPAVAEAMIHAWLKLQRLTAYSVTAEP